MTIIKKKRKYRESKLVQMPLIEWASYHPICKHFLFYIKNENPGTAQQGFLYKKMGVKKGIPDLFLAYPNLKKGYCGYFIELKAPGKKATRDQFEVMVRLREAGYLVDVFDNWSDAAEAIDQYLFVKPKANFPDYLNAGHIDVKEKIVLRKKHLLKLPKGIF